MIFIILLAVVLVGMVTAALRNTGTESAGIDREQITIRTAQLRQHAAEIERGVSFALQNGISESDISFAHPDAPAAYGTYGDNPPAEIFNPEGGGATWREPPSGLTYNSGGTPDRWEFYGTTAVPGAGTDRAELVAVLPNLLPEICAKINEINGLDSQQPEDDGDCVYAGTGDRFIPATPPATAFDTSPNTMNAATFTRQPPLQACVRCGTTDSSPLHFYHVLMTR